MRRIFAILMIGLTNGWVFAADSMDIAYLRYTDNFWQVWVTDIHGAKHRQLTFDAVDKARISWGADRTHLLCDDNNGDLSIIDTASSERTKIPLDAIAVYDAQWSPDGTEIAYTATTSVQADNAELWVVNIHSGAKRKLTDQLTITLTPAWHPPTHTILYSTGKPGKNQEIWEVDLDTGRNTQLTVSRSSALDAASNAMGDIAYSTNVSGNYDIWILDRAQKLKQITSSPAYDAQPSWSPDGKYLVFYRLENSMRRLWVHDLTSNAEYPITPPDVASRYPAWVR